MNNGDNLSEVPEKKHIKEVGLKLLQKAPVSNIYFTKNLMETKKLNYPLLVLFYRTGLIKFFIITVSDI